MTDPIEIPQHQLWEAYERYEVVRVLNVIQFGMIFRTNVASGVHFDRIVDYVSQFSKTGRNLQQSVDAACEMCVSYFAKEQGLNG